MRNTEVINRFDRLNGEPELLLMHHNGYNGPCEHYFDENKGSCSNGGIKELRNKCNTLADSFTSNDENSHISTYFTDNTDSNSMSLKYKVRNNAINKPSHINGGYKNKNIRKNVLYLILICMLGLMVFVDIRGKPIGYSSEQ